MRAILVHNPSAGDAGHDAEDLLEALGTAGYAATAFHGKSADLGRALADPGDLIVVAGGDGTVAALLKNLPRRDVPVAILPVGTANNIATSLGIAGEPRALMAGWRTAGRRQFRLGVAQGRWGRSRFVEGVGFGCVAQVTDEKAGEPLPARERHGHSWGRLREVLAAARPADLRLEADGQEVNTSCLFAEVLNIGSIGPNLGLAPGADPADWRLELVMVAPAERAAMLDWLDGESHLPPPVRRLRARRVRAEWQGVPLHLDDQFPDAESGACELTLEEAPITVLVSSGGRSQ
jgi:diacylglycerol kinase family enzyme